MAVAVEKYMRLFWMQRNNKRWKMNKGTKKQKEMEETIGD